MFCLRGTLTIGGWVKIGELSHLFATFVSKSDGKNVRLLEGKVEYAEDKAVAAALRFGRCWERLIGCLLKFELETAVPQDLLSKEPAVAITSKYKLSSSITWETDCSSMKIYIQYLFLIIIKLGRIYY